MNRCRSLYLSATRKSSGKTTIAIGLAAAIAKKTRAVQCFKKGPDYIDPLWLSKASDRPCYNLDFHTQGKAEIVSLFDRAQSDASFALIEGNKGLFDGVDLHGADSNAALAALLQTPVLLVIDARGMTRGVAPLVNGYLAFADEIAIAGVVLNQVGGPRHESKLRQVLEHYTDASVLGAVGKDPQLLIEERHLGLTTDQETENSAQIVCLATNAVESQVDIDRVMQCANPFPVASSGHVPVIKKQETTTRQPLRIGIARDPAFCFYYADDVEALTAYGAKICFFDTLHDQQLPDVDALFLGGGFPETHAQGLMANTAMRSAVRQFARSGKPVYAECGGLMYLCRSLEWKNRRYTMAGCLPADCEVQQKPVGRGYVILSARQQHPWLSLDAVKKTGPIHAHEFHYSRLINVSADIDFAYNVERGYGADGEKDGLVYGNILASYAHLRETDGTPWIQWFLRHIGNRLSRAA